MSPRACEPALVCTVLWLWLADGNTSHGAFFF